MASQWTKVKRSMEMLSAILDITLEDVQTLQKVKPFDDDLGSLADLLQEANDKISKAGDWLEEMGV